MRARLRNVFAVEIWPMPLRRLPLWVRTLICFGLGPFFGLIGIMFRQSGSAPPLSEDGLLLLVIVWPPFATLLLGANWVFDRAVDRWTRKLETPRPRGQVEETKAKARAGKLARHCGVGVVVLGAVLFVVPGVQPVQCATAVVLGASLAGGGVLLEHLGRKGPGG